MAGDIFNPQGTEWTALDATGAPQNRTGVAVGVFKSDLYFCGGIDNSTGLATRTLHRYSLIDKTFTQLADSPVDFSKHKLIVGAGVFYVWGAGGFYKYTISSNTWTSLALPTTTLSPGNDDVSMAFEGDRIFIFGGSGGNAGAASAKLIRYNTLANTWTAQADCPVALTKTCAIAWNNKLVVGYGENDTGAANNVIYELDLTTNTWAVKFTDTLTNGGTERRSPSVAIFGNDIYFFGGTDSDIVSRYNTYDDVFQAMYRTLPEGMTNFTGIVARNKFYAFGATSGAAFSIYDPYAGKPRPNFVVIPYQELFSGTEFTNAMGFSAGTTLAYDGMYYYLIRYSGETWLLPGHHIRTNVLYNQNNYRSGKAFTIDGRSYQAWGVSKDPVATTDLYAKIYGRLVAGSYDNAGYPKLAKLSVAGAGHGTGMANYEWTGTSSGAYDMRVVSLTSSINMNKTSGTVQARPFIKILDTGNFPW